MSNKLNMEVSMFFTFWGLLLVRDPNKTTMDDKTVLEKLILYSLFFTHKLYWLKYLFAVLEVVIRRLKSIAVQNILNLLIPCWKCVVVTCRKPKNISGIAAELLWSDWCCANMKLFLLQ